MPPKREFGSDKQSRFFAPTFDGTTNKRVEVVKNRVLDFEGWHYEPV
jgi:hypothetical protein